MAHHVMAHDTMAHRVLTAEIPFTPSHVSVNRVRVVDLPGIPMDGEVRGQLAYHLASVLAITRYARARAADLHLPEIFFDDGPETRAGLPRFINASLSSPDDQVRHAAEAIAVRIGRNLGHVLLALHRGDQVNRNARADWTDADWERWRRVRQVVLAGGLVSGQLGVAVLRSAREWLAAVGYGNRIAMEISPYGGDTSLLGAARYLPPGLGDAFCCDFGHTSVKRAVITLRGNVLACRYTLPPVSVVGAWHLHPDQDVQRAGRMYRDFVVDALCDGCDRARRDGRSLAPDIMVCIAAYVAGGRLLGSGTYATMSQLAPDARVLIAEAVAQRTGHACRIHLIHDGTAAAATLAGKPDTAIIALGTALGVGFPPATADGLRVIE